jgi:hypothetical protein
MNKRSMIHLNLEFSGALIPVETDETGIRIVPLKPITDAIGLEWERQRKKVSEPYLTKRLGTCTVQVWGADQRREMICIRLDRVAAFLNTVNPENVRGQGNEAAADFLESKHAEWDDLLDAYERIRSAARPVRSFSTAEWDDLLDAYERSYGFMARKIASELGASFEEGTATSAS